jgi:hypothetical protein
MSEILYSTHRNLIVSGKEQMMTNSLAHANLKQNIKVIQYMHGDFEYFHWSEKINRRYCERHGYQYVVSHETPRSDRHITWQKIPLIIKELCNCEYLLFIDADAIFYSQELMIEEELIPLMGNKDILMAQDFGSECERWTPGKPNTGVIGVKVNNRTFQFFEYWNTASEINKSTCWNWPPEQRALWNVVLPKFPDAVHIHSDYYMVHGRYGQYIRHYSIASDKERTAKMKSFCQIRNIE